MLMFDDEAARQVERTYLTPDIVAQRAAVLQALAPQPGDRVLDVGVGPGLLLADIAAAVTSAGSVAGTDISESMLRLAAGRMGEAGPPRVVLALADATSLPFGDAEFDAIVSTQVLEYVLDVPAALAEAARVLKPGGRMLVLDTDWDSVVWRSSDDARMRRVMTVWDEHLADPHLPRKLPDMLENAGLRPDPPVAIPVLNAGWDENTYSAGILRIIEAFVAGRGSVEPDDAAAWAQDLRSLGASYFFCLNRFMFVARKPD